MPFYFPLQSSLQAVRGEGVKLYVPYYCL